MKKSIFVFSVLLMLAASTVFGTGETISPNMNLVIPGVGVTSGPQWAADLNMSLNSIDLHDHSSGKGVQVTPAGFNFSSDMACNSHNLTGLRSVRFSSQGSNIAGASDVGALYEVANDLWYNDGAGNQVRITQSGSVSGASGTITGLPNGTASAAYVGASGTFAFQQATSTAANEDIGTLILRYPGSYPSPSGNYIAFQAPTTLATGYAITWPNNTPASSGSFLTESTSGVISYTNVDNSTTEINSSTIRVKDGGITDAKIQSGGLNTGSIADAAVTPAKTSASIYQKSSSCAVFSTASSSFVSVTNLSNTITTVASRPVYIFLVPDGGGTAALLRIGTGSGVESLKWEIRKDGTQIAIGSIANNVGTVALEAGVSSIATTDDAPTAASHTYDVRVAAPSARGIVVSSAKLVVWQPGM